MCLEFQIWLRRGIGVSLVRWFHVHHLRMMLLAHNDPVCMANFAILFLSDIIYWISHFLLHRMMSIIVDSFDCEMALIVIILIIIVLSHIIFLFIMRLRFQHHPGHCVANIGLPLGNGVYFICFQQEFHRFYLLTQLIEVQTVHLLLQGWISRQVSRIWSLLSVLQRFLRWWWVCYTFCAARWTQLRLRSLLWLLLQLFLTSLC